MIPWIFGIVPVECAGKILTRHDSIPAYSGLALIRGHDAHHVSVWRCHLFHLNCARSRRLDRDDSRLASGTLTAARGDARKCRS